MTRLISFILAFSLSVRVPLYGISEDKPILIITTDIGGDPDDQQSLTRLLVYSNEFNIQGLIASASGTRGELGKDTVKDNLIREHVMAYGAVYNNLQL